MLIARLSVHKLLWWHSYNLEWSMPLIKAYGLTRWMQIARISSIILPSHVGHKIMEAGGLVLFSANQWRKGWQCMCIVHENGIENCILSAVVWKKGNQICCVGFLSIRDQHNGVCSLGCFGRQGLLDLQHLKVVACLAWQWPCDGVSLLS